ncbi:MAG: YqaJ viral recombinase family protein [Clostridiales bacterium]|nr:YqaJ viral recombinase family protein [Clostridiales bacterium]
MCLKISLNGMSREEWLKIRKTGIGGSDAGAVCGLNPYSSAMNVFRDKTCDEISFDDNEAMRQGRDLEDYVAKRFSEETGLKVRKSNFMYRSEEYPFMIADVDRLIVGEDAGLECKTASAYSADKWKNGEIPAHYLIQCYHYMAVTGKKTWYIAVVILGKEFKFAKITWDNDVISDLIKIEKNFWENNVVAEVMPDPDGSEACDEVLEKYFHSAKKDSSIMLVGFDDKLKRRDEVVNLIGKLETEKAQIEQEVKAYMQDCETANSDKYFVTWTNVNTSRLDTKRIKAEKPDIYNAFLKVTSSRRFKVKSA